MGSEFITSIVKVLVVTEEVLTKRQSNIAKAQAKYYNAKYLPTQYNRDKLVLSSSKNLKLDIPLKKLDSKFIGPIKVIDAIESQEKHKGTREYLVRQKGQSFCTQVPSIQQQSSLQLERAYTKNMGDQASIFYINILGHFFSTLLKLAYRKQQTLQLQ